MSAILDLPFTLDLIMHAFEKEKDQAIWDMWISLYPLMANNTIKPVNFEEFKLAILEKQVRYTQVSDDEVMSEMLAVVAAHEGKVIA